MKRTIFLILFFLTGIAALVAQSGNPDEETVSWKEIQASESREEFNKLAQYEQNNWKNQEEQLAYLTKTYEAALVLELDTAAFDYSRELGFLYSEIDSFELAVKYLNINLEHAYDYESKANSYNVYAFLHNNTGDYTAALDYLFKSVEQAKLGGNGNEAYSLGNISSIYSALDDYDNALKYAQAALSFSKTFPSPEKEYNLSYDYSTFVDLYSQKNEKDSVEHYIELARQALSVIEKDDSEKRFKDAIVIAHTSIANYYLDNSMFEIAKTEIDEIAKWEREADNVNLAILNVKYKLGIKNYSNVLSTLENINLANEEFSVIEEVYELKIDYFRAIGDANQALNIQDELIKIQQKKYGTDRLRFSAFANAKYDAMQQKEEIENLKQAQQLDKLTIANQNYFVVIVTTLIFILLFGAAYLWKQSEQRHEFSAYLQKEVDLKTKDLEQANEELRTFNYIASHNIKEPIRNIGNFVGLIKHKLPKRFQEELSEYFLTVKSSTTQLYTLIEDFAKYTSMSKNEEIETEEIDLNILLSNVKDSLQDFIEKNNAKVHFNELPSIISNESLLYASLKNLIGNGIKYNQSEVPFIEVKYQSTELYHEIMIVDNGIGIEEEYQEKIFDMLQKLHNRSVYEGSGIGLSIVKLACEKLNGKIELESELGKGSKFILKLPN